MRTHSYMPIKSTNNYNENLLIPRETILAAIRSLPYHEYHTQAILAASNPKEKPFNFSSVFEKKNIENSTKFIERIIEMLQDDLDRIKEKEGADNRDLMFLCFPDLDKIDIDETGLKDKAIEDIKDAVNKAQDKKGIYHALSTEVFPENKENSHISNYIKEKLTEYLPTCLDTKTVESKIHELQGKKFESFITAYENKYTKSGHLNDKQRNRLKDFFPVITHYIVDSPANYDLSDDTYKDLLYEIRQSLESEEQKGMTSSNTAKIASNQKALVSEEVQGTNANEGANADNENSSNDSAAAARKIAMSIKDKASKVSLEKINAKTIEHTLGIITKDENNQDPIDDKETLKALSKVSEVEKNSKKYAEDLMKFEEVTIQWAQQLNPEDPDIEKILRTQIKNSQKYKFTPDDVKRWLTEEYGVSNALIATTVRNVVLLQGKIGKVDNTSAESLAMARFTAGETKEKGSIYDINQKNAYEDIFSTATEVSAKIAHTKEVLKKYKNIIEELDINNNPEAEQYQKDISKAIDVFIAYMDVSYLYNELVNILFSYSRVEQENGTAIGYDVSRMSYYKMFNIDNDILQAAIDKSQQIDEVKKEILQLITENADKPEVGKKFDIVRQHINKAFQDIITYDFYAHNFERLREDIENFVKNTIGDVEDVQAADDLFANVIAHGIKSEACRNFYTSYASKVTGIEIHGVKDAVLHPLTVIANVIGNRWARVIGGAGWLFLKGFFYFIQNGGSDSFYTGLKFLRSMPSNYLKDLDYSQQECFDIYNRFIRSNKDLATAINTLFECSNFNPNKDRKTIDKLVPVFNGINNMYVKELGDRKDEKQVKEAEALLKSRLNAAFMVFKNKKLISVIARIGSNKPNFIRKNIAPSKLTKMDGIFTRANMIYTGKLEITDEKILKEMRDTMIKSGYPDEEFYNKYTTENQYEDKKKAIEESVNKELDNLKKIAEKKDRAYLTLQYLINAFGCRNKKTPDANETPTVVLSQIGIIIQKAVAHDASDRELETARAQSVLYKLIYNESQKNLLDQYPGAGVTNLTDENGTNANAAGSGSLPNSEGDADKP